MRDWDTTILVDCDFTEDIDSAVFTVTSADGGTAVVGDARNGIVTVLPSDGSVGDNDECYIQTANETALLLAGKPIYGRAYLQYTEGNVNAANVIFGFMNAPIANSLIDDGGGPRVTGTLAVIYKIDGGTVWRCQSRNGTETTDTVSTTTAGGANYSLLEINIHDYTSTKVQITYKVDGTYLKDSNGKVIIHTLLVAAATEMAMFAGQKNGGISIVESLLIDRLYGHQLR